jgi:hypothetical protein
VVIEAAIKAIAISRLFMDRSIEFVAGATVRGLPFK